MRKSSPWFQLARGRAIVRKNRMAAARRHKRLGSLTLVRYMVESARRAHREWRYYRKMHAWSLACDAAIEQDKDWRLIPMPQPTHTRSR